MRFLPAYSLRAARPSIRLTLILGMAFGAPSSSREGPFFSFFSIGGLESFQTTFACHHSVDMDFGGITSGLSALGEIAEDFGPGGKRCTRLEALADFTKSA